MKVGDLVTKHPDLSSCGAQVVGVDHRLAGIIIEVEACDTHIKVYWGDYGSFWCPVDRVELISESR